MWWKSKDLSDGSIESPAASDDSLNLNLHYFNNPKFGVEFNESYINYDTFFLIKNEFVCYFENKIMAILC